MIRMEMSHIVPAQYPRAIRSLPTHYTLTIRSYPRCIRALPGRYPGATRALSA